MIAVFLALVLAVAGIAWQNWAARSGYNYALMMVLGAAIVLVLSVFGFAIVAWHGCHGAYDIMANPFACMPAVPSASGR